MITRRNDDGTYRSSPVIGWKVQGDSERGEQVILIPIEFYRLVDVAEPVNRASVYAVWHPGQDIEGDAEDLPAWVPKKIAKQEEQRADHAAQLRKRS